MNRVKAYMIKCKGTHIVGNQKWEALEKCKQKIRVHEVKNAKKKVRVHKGVKNSEIS